VAQRSLLGQFLEFWGAQLLLLAPILLAALSGVPASRRVLAGSLTRSRAAAIVTREAPGWEPALWLAGGVAGVWLAEQFGGGVLALCLLFATAAGWAARQALRGDLGGGRPLAFVFGAICLGALLLAACEVVYIRDFYGGALRRMNTVFKLYYEAWLLFATGGSVAAFWLLRRLWRGRDEGGGRWALGAFGVACVLLALAAWQFPSKVLLLRTDNFQNPSTLDGMDWMRRYHPDDYAAAHWLLAHGATPGMRAPVLLEATGGAYSEFARMATATGFPTVLGWDQHERLWRGAAINDEVAARQRDVDAIYKAGALQEVRPLLDQYNITYVVVGYLEAQKYGGSAPAEQQQFVIRFDAAAQAAGFTPVFHQGQTTIYRTTK
jgi:uncharacterized membrane protein